MYSLSNEAEMSVKSIFDSFRSKRILSLSWVIFESKYSSHSSGVQSLTEYESKGIYNRVAQVTYPDSYLSINYISTLANLILALIYNLSLMPGGYAC